MSGQPVLTRTPGAAVGVSSAPGTFGELIQGVLPDGADFLVTLPVGHWATATFVAEPDRPGIVVRPAHKEKALRVARDLFNTAGYAGGGRLWVDSCIPEGKGMASSSADLVATARAVGNALDLPMTAQSIEDHLRRVEPTDGVMYPGLVAFHHRRVSLLARLGDVPPLTVVALDEGGVVDSVRFNRRPKPFTGAQREEYAHLLQEVTVAVARGDLDTLGRAATRSGALNQALQPKRTFAALCDGARRIGALGVVVAHSGTVAGLLLADDDPRYPRRRAQAVALCRELAGNASVYHVLSGTQVPRTEGQTLCATRM